jgi:hypothetical protein
LGNHPLTSSRLFRTLVEEPDVDDGIPRRRLWAELGVSMASVLLAGVATVPSGRLPDRTAKPAKSEVRRSEYVLGWG